MTARTAKAQHFLDLHQPGSPLLLPNPWDAGIAKLLTSAGFQALATTSSGFAGTLGRGDGNVTRDEAIEHGRAIAAATDLPVSADLESGFGDSPADVAETMRRAAATGLAGCSVEDYSDSQAFYEPAEATARVAAAAKVTRSGDTRLILTARAENYLRARPDLGDTIARLQSFENAGADVLYAPGLSDLAEIERLVKAVNLPVNVLVLPGGPTVAELASVGVARISVGGAFHLASVAAVEAAARELLDSGTLGFWEQAMAGMKAHHQAID